ncbi:MAG: hypothetical protein GY862_01190, partial [Gammaproteobacteria bacterium]|nr:hypothetical protein [Gammaproteobacteria bacterium]
TPALGDLDGDGKPEIVAYLPERKVIVLHNDGTETWVREAVFDAETVLALSGPAIADLDADGQAEIIAANVVLNADGSVKWAGSPTSTLTPVAVDLDKDGAPEVVTGRHVYRADGSLYWSFPNNCGFYSASVADFDGDAYPEIISVTANKISLFEHDGTLKGAIGVAGVQTGSPAMIADLDGDGAPEIGIGGTAHFQVFDSNSGLKWQTPVSAPSGMAGASVFDFEGDGRAEIVYQDAETLYIFAGDTGEILFSTPNAPSAGSAVWIEYPVIADIDNDGHADLLVANGSGIRVFQDADNAWANARGIWNQHTYHITNVDNDGGIPLREESNWEIYNSWRGTRIPGGNDLSAGYPRIIDNGPGQGLAVQVRAGNAGAATSPAELSIAFYAGDPAAGGVLLGTAAVGALEPGTWQDLQADGIESSAFEQEIYALIDADERLPECNETNNSVSLISRIVSGYIRDKSGAPLSGAAVQINGRPETAVTDANGYYRIIGLAEGVYTLSIAKEGYLFEAKEIVVGGNNPEVDLVCTVCGGTPGYAPGYILIARETGHNEIVIRDGEGELVRRFDTGTTGNDISVATGDFFGDGADRIVVNADKQLQFYDFDGEKLAVLAVEKQGDVAAGDIDGDGMEEALTTAKSANDNRVTVYGTNGEVRTVDIGSAGKNTRLSVAAADLDGDGAAEIIAGTLLKDNKVALYSADGTELAVFEVFSDVNARTVRKPGDQGNACSHSGQGVPKFCDDADTDNGDGADTDNGDGADTDNGDGADTDNGDGADTDNDGGGGKKYGVNVAAGDLDGDGVPELVAGMAGKGGVVEVYTVSGGLIHSFSAFDDNSGVEISVGDTDGDGEGEIIAGNAKGTEVRIFKADGTLLRVFAGLDRERVGSLAFAKGSAPVTAVAVDAGLQPISTDAELFGGVSVSGKPRMPKASVHTNDTVKITAKIKADKKHAGKHAKIVTVFNYSPGGEDLPPQNFILNAQGIVMPWDGDPDTLADTGANNGVTLGEGETLSIYEGRLPQGVINIFFGYRVEEDGALIFNGAPISITIHGEK